MDPTNDALRKAWQRGTHLIYFMGVTPAVYQPVFPVWIRLPDDPRDRPDLAHLEYRFRQFRERR